MKPHSSDLQKEFTFAQSVIDETRELVHQLWSSGPCRAELKADATPVTEVDLKVEELVRDRIRKAFPTHGVCGEEYGLDGGAGEFLWTIDPIDGTQSLMHGIPTFGTLLGLRRQGEAVLGIIDHPALNVRVEGLVGVGAFKNGERVSIRDLDSREIPHNDVIAMTTLEVFERRGRGSHFHALAEFHRSTRVYYDCFAHTLAVSGALAAAVEYNLCTWDLTPSEAIVAAAGGAWRFLGEIGPHAPKVQFNAVFGKPRAVEAVATFLASLP